MAATAPRLPSLRARLEAAWTAFLGPGLPVAPAPFGGPSRPQDLAPAPRVRTYPPGVNTTLATRTDEALPPHAQLRSLAQSYDVAAIAINYLRTRLEGLEWSIVPVKHAPPDTAQTKAAAIERISEFLAYPDGDTPLHQWMGMLLLEDLEIGAPWVWKQRSRGGELLGLEIVEGDLMKPLIDERGKVIGAEQIYKGQVLGQYDIVDWIYAPRIRRRGSAFGISPTEFIMLAVNLALRRQMWQISYFTDGNIPDALAGTPPDWQIEDVQKFQEWFDTLVSGEDEQRRKIHMWPGDTSKIHEFRPYDPSTEPEMWLLQITLAAFNVRPEELGFTETVNRSTGEVQADSQNTAIQSLAIWGESIFTRVIQRDLHEPLLQFQYAQETKQKATDIKARADADAVNIKNRIYSAAYVRQRDGIQLAEDDLALLEEEQVIDRIKHPPPPPPQLAPPGTPPGPGQPPTATPSAPSTPSTSTSTPPNPAEGTPRPSAGPAQPAVRPTASLAQRLAVNAELAQWSRKVLARLEAGRVENAAAVPFTAQVIAPGQVVLLLHALDTVTTPAAARRVFRAVELAATQEAARAALVLALEEEVAAWLRALWQAAAMAVQEVAKAYTTALDWPTQQTSLEAVFTRWYPLLIGRAVQDVEADLGRPVSFDPLSPDVQAIMESIALRVTGITETQRGDIARLVNEFGADRERLVAALEAGAGLQADRARMIATTEAVAVANLGTVIGAEAAGLRRVYVTDGDYDGECAAVNGTYQTLAWARANPLAHPWCRRRFYADDAAPNEEE